MKIAVLSHVLPPNPSGQSMVLYRLLKGTDPDQYCLVTNDARQGAAIKRENGSDGSCEPLSCHYHTLPEERELSRPTRFGGARARALLNVPLKVVKRARNLTRIFKREGHAAIVACSGDPLNLPAAYLASRLARIGFYAYIFDDYLYQWTQPLYRSWARYFEPILLRGAKGVIVPNEFLRAEYLRRYHVDSTVIHNPCELGHYDADLPWPRDPSEVRIVFTGAVYHAHYDAFRSLIAAIERLKDKRVLLHLYSAQPREEMEREGIVGPVVFHPHVRIEEVMEVQRQADILFLPLALNSPIPEVIRTSAPGKMGEYLASGRPVLAHVPPGSFVEWYFQSKDCGLVVTQGGGEELAQAIRQLLEDGSLRKRLIENARQCAQLDFDVVQMQARFRTLLGVAAAGA